MRAALVANNGLLSKTAKALNVTPQTLRRYIKRYDLASLVKPGKLGMEPHHTPEQIAKALQEACGLVTPAALKLGIQPRTVRSYVAKHEKLRELLDETREAVLDKCESKLFQHIENGNLGAIIFYLKCIGKHRGYIERGEITGPNNGPIQVIALDTIESAMRAAQANACPLPPAPTPTTTALLSSNESSKPK